MLVKIKSNFDRNHLKILTTWLSENADKSYWQFADDFGGDFYFNIEDDKLAVLFKLKFG